MSDDQINKRRRGSVLVRLCLRIVAFTLVWGCATSEPWEEGPPDGPRRYRVRFEVKCDQCTIQWAVGPYNGTDTDRGLWSHRAAVILSPGDRTTASLMASPVPGSDAVSWVRVRVNGDVVAQASSDSPRAFRPATPGPLTVEARIPPSSRDESSVGSR